MIALEWAAFNHTKRPLYFVIRNGTVGSARRRLATADVPMTVGPAARRANLRGHGVRILALYRRYVPRLGHNQTIGIIAHRLCRLV